MENVTKGRAITLHYDKCDSESKMNKLGRMFQKKSSLLRWLMSSNNFDLNNAQFAAFFASLPVVQSASEKLHA
jgi:hypothetical protein